MSPDVEQLFKTATKFNEEVKSWSLRVRGVSINILSTHTKSSGALKRKLSGTFRMDKEKVYIRGVGFRFERYGAFRAYGAGRGYVVKDGVIVRGYTAWGDKVMRSELQKKGEKDSNIRRMKKYIPDGVVKRTPLDWIDKPIDRSLNELADIAGEYHGDAALKDVLKQLNKLTIKKK